MKLSKYGITLDRLKKEDIELVRKWRNSPQINQFMEYREYITPGMQEEWFRSVDNFDNFYFIIEFDGEKIGLINSSNIDWSDISSAGGIFLWDEKYYETMVPVWASLCLLESTFFVLGAGRSVIKTLNDNERAKKLNTHLGYVLQEGQEKVYNQVYVLTPESFRQHAGKLIKAAAMLAGPGADEHTLFFGQDDIRSGLADFVGGRIRKEMIRQYLETKEGRLYVFKATAV